MIFIGLYIAFLIGLFLGFMFNTDETCPRALQGYNCKGEYCDHRKSTLYQAHLDMAKADESRQAGNNLWGGN